MQTSPLPEAHPEVGQVYVDRSGTESVAQAGCPFSTREGVFGICLVGSRLLLATPQHTPVFDLPGGGIDPGETAVEALVREIAEETGLEITVAEGRKADFHQQVRFHPEDKQEFWLYDQSFHLLRDLPAELLFDGERISPEQGVVAWHELSALPEMNGLHLKALSALGLIPD